MQGPSKQNTTGMYLQGLGPTFISMLTTIGYLEPVTAKE